MGRPQRRASIITLSFVFATSAACAQFLGYDDYHARTEVPVVETGISDAEDVSETAPTATARPPARPPGERAPSNMGRTLWLGAKRMYLGNTTALGVTSPDGWRDWGFDVDRVCTTLEDAVRNVGTCRRDPEANQDVLVDGDLCRDNNFGRHVIGLLTVSSEGFDKKINDGIFEGNSTWIMRIDDLDDGADDPYAPARFFHAASAAAGTVKWDGSDVRRVSGESVTDKSLEKPLIAFPNGYVRDHVWVSGEPLESELILPFSSELRVPLRGMIITLQLEADHKNGKRAALGGAIPMSALESVLRPVAESAGFCPGTPLYESLLRKISRFPDLVAGAPNFQDETRACDAMSLGIGFDVQSIQPVVEVVDPPPVDPGKCADAGTDGG
jgi:hypothetical protein